MGKFCNLIGRRYNRLIVEERAGKTKYGCAIWKCRCDCGNVVYVTTGNLNNKGTQSCGCLKSENGKIRGKNNTKPKHKNIAGIKKGMLTPISYAYTKNYKSYWNCICDCGNICVKSKDYIDQNNNPNCGCITSKLHSKNGHKNVEKHFTDLTGKTFYRWFVESFAGYKTKKDRRDGMWNCVCINCKTKKQLSTYVLTTGRSKSCGCLRSFGEEQISKILKNKNINFTTGFYYDDLRGPNNGVLYFDFAVFNKDNVVQYLIEFQGKQHFIEPTGNKNFGKLQREITDSLKREYCKNNNIKLYEIRYDEDVETKIEKIIYEETLLRKIYA